MTVTIEHYQAPEFITADDPRLREYSALGGLYTSATQTKEVWTVDQLNRHRQSILPPRLLVARVEMGQIAGALSYDDESETDSVYVSWLAVKGRYRGKRRIGCSLLATLEMIAEHGHKSEVYLDASNSKSAEFYERRGYCRHPEEGCHIKSLV